jgi:excisionase family DNA binding protein
LTKAVKPSTSAGQWLSLSEVAGLLGVHPSTVRSWSDRGRIPYHRTQGGHRRYQRSEIELWQQSQRAEEPADIGLVVQNALRNTRFQVSEGRLAQEGWYARLDDEVRDQYRRSGRTLLQGLINYLNSEPGKASAEAEAIGYEYASRAHRNGLNEVDAAHAFLFFRNLLMDSMLSVYESASVQSPYAWSNLFRRVNCYTDEIMIALLETYDAYQRVNR